MCREQASWLSWSAQEHCGLPSYSICSHGGGRSQPGSVLRSYTLQGQLFKLGSLIGGDTHHRALAFSVVKTYTAAISTCHKGFGNSPAGKAFPFPLSSAHAVMLYCAHGCLVPFPAPVRALQRTVSGSPSGFICPPVRLPRRASDRTLRVSFVVQHSWMMVDDICTAASWSSPCSFVCFYLLDVSRLFCPNDCHQ